MNAGDRKGAKNTLARRRNIEKPMGLTPWHLGKVLAPDPPDFTSRIVLVARQPDFTFDSDYLYSS